MTTARLLVLLTGVVALTSLVVGFLLVADADQATLGVVVGLVAPTVTALVAVIRTEANLSRTEDVHHAVNGGLTKRIREAVGEALHADAVRRAQPWDGVERRRRGGAGGTPGGG